MSIFVKWVVLVDVPPPSCQMMVSLAHKEHLASKVDNVGVILEHGIKLLICLLPWWTPRGHDIVKDKEDLLKVVVRRLVEGTFTVTVIHDKFIFQPRDINLVDEPNKRKTSQVTQWNKKPRFFKRFDSNPMNYNIGVLFCDLRISSSVSSAFDSARGHMESRATGVSFYKANKKEMKQTWKYL